jgi:ferritin-like metal-binding protein YciE
MDSLNELFEDQIKDLYSAEQQLLKALPKVAKKTANADLKQSIEDHRTETEQHAERLTQVAELVGFKPSGKKCKAMEGLIEEGDEVLKEKGDENVIDLAIIAAARRIEHYEISAYQSAIRCAEQLGLSEIAELLTLNLEDEEKAEETLTEASDSIFEAAASGEAVEVDEEDTKEKSTVRPARNGARGSRNPHPSTRL